MQAIARVNRVFPEKSGGLVVDYIGIAKALKKAMHDYTGRDKKTTATRTSRQPPINSSSPHSSVAGNV